MAVLEKGCRCGLNALFERSSKGLFKGKKPLKTKEKFLLFCTCSPYLKLQP
jgi:hypothetical protein